MIPNALLSALWNGSQNVRFVITCNDPYGVDDALRSRCANYLLQPFLPMFRFSVLRYYRLMKGVDFDEDSVLRIVDFVVVISVVQSTASSLYLFGGYTRTIEQS